MKKLTKEDGSSLDVVNENVEKLRGIYPEAFTEDGIDFDVLRQLLGDEVAEGEEKHFQRLIKKLEREFVNA